MTLDTAIAEEDVTNENEPSFNYPWGILIDEKSVKSKPDLTLTDFLENKLTTKELEIFSLMSTGIKNKAIAKSASITLRTVERRMWSISKKMGMLPDGYQLRPSLVRLFDLAFAPSLEANVADIYITERELEVANLAEKGYNNSKIAEILEILPRTVERHIGNIINEMSGVVTDNNVPRVVLTKLYRQGKLQLKNAEIEQRYIGFDPWNYIEKNTESTEPDSVLEKLLSERLSEREFDVLTLVALGHSNQSLADALFIQPRTAERHVGSILHKLNPPTGYHSRSSLVVIYDMARPSSLTVTQGEKITLTPRRYELAALIGQGYANDKITEIMGIQPRTVERHIYGLLTDASEFIEQRDNPRAILTKLYRQGSIVKQGYEVEIDQDSVWGYLEAKNNGAKIEIPNEGVASYLRGNLTRTTLEVMKFVAGGLNNDAIAQVSTIEGRTVERHIGNILSNLGYPPENYSPRVALSLLYQMAFPIDIPVKRADIIPLSNREYEVAQLIAMAHNNKSISKKLGIQPRTIERHIGVIFDKIELVDQSFFHSRVYTSYLFNNNFLTRGSIDDTLKIF